MAFPDIPFPDFIPNARFAEGVTFAAPLGGVIIERFHGKLTVVAGHALRSMEVDCFRNILSEPISTSEYFYPVSPGMTV